MMKWKTRTETTNIGVLELGNLTFNDDYMEVSIDIYDMSDSLKADVEKAIEARKIESAKEWGLSIVSIPIIGGVTEYSVRNRQ